MYASTVSFYSWELRACYLFKVDTATKPPHIVVLVPAKSLWAVRQVYQVMHLREVLGVIHLPTARAERLCLQLCNATTEREQRKTLQPDTAVFFNYSERSSFKRTMLSRCITV